ncbi:MAG: ABC transporter substrate-binding protein [Betaproteobacteria bacterium]|nr:ABC transporter substrate-binding protein [Betaproteobacteria bacterium]
MNDRRRTLLIALGTGAFAGPLELLGQPQGKLWRVGFLSSRHVDLLDSDYYYGPFRQGMRELGYVEGRNLVIEWRSAEGDNARLPGLAEELVRLKLDVLITAGTPTTLAVQKTASPIPHVMIGVGDPVGNGLVKSLARPGGNTTGLSNITSELAPKLLELLRAMLPKVSRLAVLVNRTNVTHVAQLEGIQAAAGRLGVRIVPAEARSPQEIESALSAAARQNAGAIIVLLEPLFQQQKSQIVELAAKHRLPSIGAYGEFVEAGGLMSYGANLNGISLRAATYVDKIFKGAKPADLPVEQPTKFELFINRKTAKALGLTIPQSLLISADRVID